MAPRSFPTETSCGNCVANRDFEARISGGVTSVRVICQYQPENASSNWGAIAAGVVVFPSSLGIATLATSALRYTPSWSSKFASVQRALSALKPSPASARMRMLQNAAERKRREAIERALNALPIKKLYGTSRTAPRAALVANAA